MPNFMYQTIGKVGIPTARQKVAATSFAVVRKNTKIVKEEEEETTTTRR